MLLMKTAHRLKSISKVKSGDDVIINISDGKIITTVNEVKEGK